MSEREDNRPGADAGATRPCFEGFPYLITRMVPSFYHVLLLGREPFRVLADAARVQVAANHLDSCLVLGLQEAVYFDGVTEAPSTSSQIPRGGIPTTGRLAAGTRWSLTADLQRRAWELAAYIERHRPRGGYLLGDLTKGGRPASDDERQRLAGRGADGVPLGLHRCVRCEDWRGECLDPNPHCAHLIVPVHCRCDNHNRCAPCGRPLDDHRLNGNEYNPRDGQVWHTPGFVAFAHRCPGDVEPARPRGLARTDR